jgi:uncharacterized protein (TIGR03435 family)
MILKYLSAVWAATAPAMGNHLWQSTLCLIIAGLLTLLLRKNHARARYGLWLASSIKFLIPFSLLIGIGSHLAKPRVVPPTEPGLFFAMEQVSQPFTPAAHVIPPVVHSTTSPNLVHLLPAILVAIWFCGFLVVLLAWYAHWRRISAALQNAEPLREGREVEALRRVERLGGIRKPIELLLSPASLEPGVFGIVRPVLVWPKGISEHLPDAHLEAIVAHEVWHVRRRDNLAAAIHMVVEALFWFHPLVWWLGARLIDERERACDEEVLEWGSERQVYAESILKTCEFCLESPLACVSGITGADLKKRIVRIMTARLASKLSFSTKLLLAAACIAAVAGPVTFGIVKGPQASAQSAGAPEWEKAAGGRMEFEVAAVRESTSDMGSYSNVPLGAGDAYRHTGGLFSGRFSLLAYIEFAYKVSLTPDEENSMLAHLPKWVASDHFVIQARAPSENPTKDQMRLMMQSLLVERFKLAVHFESRETRVLALNLIQPGKTGPGLRRPPSGVRPCDSDHPQFCGKFYVSSMPGQPLIRVESRNATMGLIAHCFDSIAGLGRPVVDQTGLTGSFDLAIEWAQDLIGSPPSAADNQAGLPGATFQQALKEQLGVKLVKQNAQVQVLVIDHVERPSEN